MHPLRGSTCRLALLLAGLLPLAACRTAPAGEERGPGRPPDGVHATVTMAAGTVESYTGTGHFGVNDADGINHPKTFSMNSRPASREARGRLSLWRYQGAERASPPVGTYPVAIPDNAQPRWAGFAAAYYTEADGWNESYVGRNGTVIVTESSPGRFAGRFRFTAVRYYRRPMRGTGREPGMVLGRPSEVPPDQPTVEITGTFVAYPEAREAVGFPRPLPTPPVISESPRPSPLRITLRAEPRAAAPGDTVRFTAVAHNPTRDTVNVGRGCGPGMDVLIQPPKGPPTSIYAGTIFTCDYYDPAPPRDSVTQRLNWLAPGTPGAYVAVAGERYARGQLTNPSNRVTVRVVRP